MNKTTHFNIEPRDDCGKLNKTHVNKQVSLYGWAHRRRDHGGVIFVDLRDATGMVQIVCNPDTQQSFTLAETIRAEYVLQVVGTVRDRPEGTINLDMPTGDIEVVVVSLNILATSRSLPFGIDEHQQVSEDVRLRYRYLDLRRSSMHHNLVARAKTVSCVRNYLEKQGFIDIETPTLTRATPEGARDYLAPSRTHSGTFFALPQSPQLFKQLLMVAGFERYYQIVKCYRDEDLRADRQPEFTQIDIEASFTNEQAIMALTETMLRGIFANANIALSEFPQITYADAMRLYGSDKPDLRIACQLIDVADICQDVDFAVFNKPAQDPHSRIAMLCVPGTSLSRKDIDDLTKYVAQFGAKGLAYIQVRDPHDIEHGLQSPIIKFLPHQVRKQFIHRANAKAGDILFFGADKTNIVNDIMGALRVHLGHKLSLVEKGFRPVWVTDFPMFECDKSNALTPLHHPFTSPSCSLEEFIASPHTANSRAYDVVLNGIELGGGSIRIHDYHTQLAVLATLGIDSEQAQEKFGFLLDALQYGCPPHGGIALGLDRIVMMMVGVTSIRDVIAFPKTQSAACLLTGAPTYIEPQTLAELGVQSIGSVVASQQQ